jgi:hypothetical protein
MCRLFVFATILTLGLSPCLSKADVNLLVNADFQGGTYIATAPNFNGPGTVSKAIPNGWTASQGFIQFPFNGISGSTLFIGNNVGDPVAGLSQTFNDIPGQSYTVTFLLGNVYPTGFFAAGVGNSPEVFVAITQVGGGWITPRLETFNFVGTGNDTFGISAANSLFSYTASDFVVSPSVPEPSTWTMILLGFAGLGFAWSRRRVSFA